MDKQEQYAKLAELTAAVEVAVQAAQQFAKDNDLTLMLSDIAMRDIKEGMEAWEYSAKHWSYEDDDGFLPSFC